MRTKIILYLEAFICDLCVGTIDCESCCQVKYLPRVAMKVLQLVLVSHHLQLF